MDHLVHKIRFMWTFSTTATNNTCNNVYHLHKNIRYRGVESHDRRRLLKTRHLKMKEEEEEIEDDDEKEAAAKAIPAWEMKWLRCVGSNVNRSQAMSAVLDNYLTK